jgi:hypothetical protein
VTDSAAQDAVGHEERLARFVLFSKWIRADHTVKQDAFIPYPYADLSVTRHLGISVEELWCIGEAVANHRSKTLYGRADLIAMEVCNRRLQLVPTLQPKNHVNITGWPADKPSQKIIAAELAAIATFVLKPQAKESVSN